MRNFLYPLVFALIPVALATQAEPGSAAAEGNQARPYSPYADRSYPAENPGAGLYLAHLVPAAASRPTLIPGETAGNGDGIGGREQSMALYRLMLLAYALGNDFAAKMWTIHQILRRHDR